MNNERHGPWCFVDQENDNGKISWEPCFVACDDISTLFSLVRPDNTVVWLIRYRCTVDRTCVRYKEIPFNKNDYLGTENRTYKGKQQCLKWNSVYKTGEYSKWSHNYCRAASLTVDVKDKPKTPWCHVDKNLSNWQLCFPNCHDIGTVIEFVYQWLYSQRMNLALAACMERTETTLPYKGVKMRSVNDRPCGDWKNAKNELSKKYPATDDDYNYCRNFGFLAAGKIV